MPYKDPKKEKEYNKKWCQENKERKKEHNKKYRQENKEYYKKWCQENKEEIKEYNKKYRQENKEYDKKYRQNNPEVSLKSNRKSMTKLGLEFKLPYQEYSYALLNWTKSVRKILGEYCSICGSKDGLNSHHIFPKAIHPKLSLNVNNGIPLCKEHHQEVHRLNPKR